MFKRKEPKYNIGDIVRFMKNSFSNERVYSGRIWKIHTYWFCNPSYEIFQSIGFGQGYNYRISESNIIELLEKGDRKSVSNPFRPIKQIKIK